MTDARTTKRAAILAAASTLFVDRGYAGTSLRDIGRAADADAALVIHHFGSKDGLFLAVLESVGPQHPISEGPLDSLGERFIRFVLDAGPQVRSTFLAMLRAADSDSINEELRRQHELAFVGPLRARLIGADADLRASLAAGLVGGLLYALWVVGDETLLAADHDQVVAKYGRLLQELIDPA
ncbi:TetR family transcriptional regulator [Curtobacterium sp. RRHDQ66]|uniref:TetR/AcrR family transcriptional regulator n=1 Tax=Curtobacterium guangdongense TaxID=3413380 RepID=UPI003BF30366